MVKYNWEEKYLIELGIPSPKRFKIDARKQIEDSTLHHLQKFGRNRWVSVSEIFQERIRPTDLFNSKGGNFIFCAKGIKSNINAVTLALRRKHHPIISGKGHKGYMYADENCDDFIERWNEKFDAWEGRKTKLSKEKELDINLIEGIIAKLLARNRIEEAQQLQEVLVKYSQNEKN